jgi:hypothetical protein
MRLRSIATEIRNLLRLYGAGWAGYFGIAVFGFLIVFGVAFGSVVIWLGSILAVVVFLIVIRDEAKRQKK